MKLLTLILLSSLNVFSAELVTFENSWNLFSQKLGPDFNLPVPLSAKEKMVIQFELPEPNGAALKKVFSKSYTVAAFKAVFEIYFFDQNQQKYFSQQIYLYKDGNLVTRCASYFGLEQKFLVPGSCAGVQGDELLGIALYK
ncbi:MAG: hypothetical protein K0R29_801 [Pseudobdellovibrio sp.]|jgi:hypothetical protein|nr:hypothetical protein [Pseudobdellovibrio sp.]